MPELPEVETTGRGLTANLLGRTLTSLEQRRKDLRHPIPMRLQEQLSGAKLIAVDRRAKYLLLRFSNQRTLLVHLGMSGRLVIDDHDDGARGPHDHLVFHFSGGKIVRFNDARRFGCVDLLTTGTEATHKLLRDIGPEPLERSFTPKVLHTACAGRQTAIKLALLDQHIVAGIGNIYACEALYLAGINPKRAAGSISLEEFKRLVPAIKKVLKAAIDAGGSSLRDYVQTSGELGVYQNNFAVYDREGQACPDCTCHEGVQRFTQGGRSTFWCRSKQR